MTAVITQTLKRHTARAARRYNAYELAMLFFAFAMIGWVWEVFLHIMFDGELVNRGTMLGPWLPIYGVGGAIVTALLRRLADRPVAVFLASSALCAAIEFIASVYLEAVYGLRWWDYSAYTFNIDGRVCLETTVGFGIGCCIALYIAAPAIANRLGSLPQTERRVLCAALILLFAADFVYSTISPNTGKGITDDGPGQAFVQVDPTEVSQLNLMALTVVYPHQ